MLTSKDPYHPRIAAGASRIALAAFALVVLAPIYATIHALAYVLYGYIATSTIFLVLIVLRVGDRPRAIAGGIVDMFLITVLVHSLGSTASVMTTVYIFAAVLNTLTVGPRVGFIVSVLACVFYGALLLAEHHGVVEVVRMVNGVERHHAAPIEAFASWALTTVMLMATTAIVGMLVDMNTRREGELRAANERLLALTNRDPLTDLWNRRYLFERIESAFAKKKHGRFALAVFDLDGFKSVNDRFGHLTGDALLQAIARAIVEAAAERDVVCRFGGDEFVVLLREVDSEEAERRAHALRRAVRDGSNAFRQDCAVTTSVGVTMSRASDDAASLMRRADDLAYGAKRAGGDRVTLESSEG